MHIKDYFLQIEKTLNSFLIVRSRNITFDDRSDFIGLIKGTIYFIDNSFLQIKEFVNAEDEIERYKYAYHYQDGDKLIFRYDNAKDSRAFKLSSFPDHKHVDNKVINSVKVDLVKVLEEITGIIFKEKKI